MSPLRRRWKPPAMAIATKTTRTEERRVADGSAENDVEAGDEAAALFFVLLPELDPFFELPDLFFLPPMAALLICVQKVGRSPCTCTNGEDYQVLLEISREYVP
mmetsp:Transcript_7322/g.15978  ORF Transcript_7322/g.15978 Transcript_7322/m.15978 type:complete len:104 (-) Transcript_7322:54-365(-)